MVILAAEAIVHSMHLFADPFLGDHLNEDVGRHCKKRTSEQALLKNAESLWSGFSSCFLGRSGWKQKRSLSHKDGRGRMTTYIYI